MTDLEKLVERLRKRAEAVKQRPVGVGDELLARTLHEVADCVEEALLPEPAPGDHE